jgi:hypothetical protein
VKTFSAIAKPAPEQQPSQMNGQHASDPDIASEALSAQPVVQLKLSVGAADDAFEKEADSVADTVMRMPQQNFIQRKCAHCDEEESVQRRPISSTITPLVQAKGETGTAINSNLNNRIVASQGGGSSMDGGTQSFMQNRFAADFNNVKIHTGGEAVQMSKELNAKAFTVGNDIYFNQGEYQPHSDSGKHLLAHELTHTIQQQKGVVSKKIQRAEFATYVSRLGPANFLDAAAAFYTNWGYPRVRRVNHMQDIVTDLGTATGIIEKFRIVAHANPSGLQLGMMSDFGADFFSRESTTFNAGQPFIDHFFGHRIIDDALYTDLTTALLADAGTAASLGTIGITAVPARNSQQGQLLVSIIEAFWLANVQLDTGGTPVFTNRAVMDTFNSTRRQTYAASITAAAPAANRAAITAAITSLRTNATGVLNASGVGIGTVTAADATNMGGDLLNRTTNRGLDPEINRAIQEGTGTGPYLTAHARARTHIDATTQVEIRGCNAGTDPAFLDDMMGFFGAGAVSAPDLFQYYFGLPFQGFNAGQTGDLQTLFQGQSNSFGNNAGGGGFAADYNMRRHIQNRDATRVVEDTTLADVLTRYNITTATADEIRQLNPDLGDSQALTPGKIIWLKARFTVIPVGTFTNLADFCRHHFNTEYAWPRIWALNPTITDATNIPPGTQIRVIEDALAQRVGMVSAEIDEATFISNLRAGEVTPFMESTTQPRLIHDEATRTTAMGRWMAAQGYDFSGRTAAQLTAFMNQANANFNSRSIMFMSRTFPNIEDPIFPDDPRFAGHIKHRP